MMYGQVYNRPFTAHDFLIETVLLHLEGRRSNRDLLIAVGWAHRYDADRRRKRVLKEDERRAAAINTQQILNDRRRRLGY